MELTLFAPSNAAFEAAAAAAAQAGVALEGELLKGVLVRWWGGKREESDGVIGAGSGSDGCEGRGQRALPARCAAPRARPWRPRPSPHPPAACHPLPLNAWPAAC